MLSPKEEAGDSGRAIESGTWNRKKVEYVARRIIVQFDASTTEKASALRTACDDVTKTLPGGRVRRRPRRTGRAIIEVAPGESVTKHARAVAKLEGVVYAEPDVIDHAAVVPNDARYTDQWAHGVVGSEAAWDLETGDANVLVGIIDSGISMSGGVPDHPDLSGARVTIGTDYVDGGTPRDTNGHGTHVAGIAAGVGNNSVGIAGMAWTASLYVCRTLDVNGSGSSADFADAVEEITDFALANRMRAVINYSGGGGDNMTKRNAAQYASDNGMLLCAATGNDFGGPVIFPAAYSTTIPGVVAVGSTTSTDGVSQFSNVGPEVTVVAPGGDMTPAGVIPAGETIVSSFPTYPVTIPGGPNFAGIVGTSMATPLVSGLASLIWSRHPSYTNQKVKDCLTDTAVKLGAGNFHNSWGFGRVDAEQALKCGGLVIGPTVIPHACPTRLPVDCVPTRVPRDCFVTRVSVDCWHTRIPRDCFPSRLPVDCWHTRIPRDCFPSRVTACPTPLPVLCPTSRLAPDCRSEVDACPSALLPDCGPPGGGGGVLDSRLVVCGSAVDACPSAMNPDCIVDPSRFQPDCRVPIDSRLGCGSEVDACPSSLGCGPTVVFRDGPGRFRPDARFAAERWEDHEGRWFYVDERGDFQAFTESSAEDGGDDDD